MSHYTVTLQLPNRERFMHLLDQIGPMAGQLLITVTDEEETPADWTPSEPTDVVRRRGPRGSKVNDTILAAMQEAPQTVKALKEALEANGLSAGSLSTGIATLTKAERIERVAEGTYALVGATTGIAQAA